MNKSRREKTEEKWRRLVGQWEASGKTAIAWCREQSITYISFIAWRKRLKQIPEKNTDFVELTDSTPTHSGIEIHLRDLTLQLTTDFDSDTLHRCLKVLERVR